MHKGGIYSCRNACQYAKDVSKGKNHIIYDLYKDNIKVAFTTVDMTCSNTDLLNEYCKIFNAFPFNLHDLVMIILNILNNINVNSDLKNNLISEFRTKVNELL